MKFFPAQFYPTIPYKTVHLEAKTTQHICARFFNQKFLANLHYFTSNDRANNFTSDSEKLIAVCYSQQKLYTYIFYSCIGYTVYTIHYTLVCIVWLVYYTYYQKPKSLVVWVGET